MQFLFFFSVFLLYCFMGSACLLSTQVKECRLLHGWKDWLMSPQVATQAERKRQILRFQPLRCWVARQSPSNTLWVLLSLSQCNCVDPHLTSLVIKLSQFKKWKGLEALEAALKCHSDASMEAVKLPPGMFITTHPWPFWALLPVYSWVFFFKTGRFIAWFKDMKLWGQQQTSLSLSNAWLPNVLFSRFTHPQGSWWLLALPKFGPVFAGTQS